MEIGYAIYITDFIPFQNAFVEIYNKQIWGGRNTKVSKDDINYKASGPGSALGVSQVCK